VRVLLSFLAGNFGRYGSDIARTEESEFDIIAKASRCVSAFCSPFLIYSLWHSSEDVVKKAKKVKVIAKKKKKVDFYSFCFLLSSGF
jgi:hypothetical protein